MRCRAIAAVLNEILGLHNKPKAVVHLVHKLMGPKKTKMKTKKTKKKKKKMMKKKMMKKKKEKKEEE